MKTAKANKETPAKAGATVAKKKTAANAGSTGKKNAKEIILEIAAEEFGLGNTVLDRSRPCINTDLSKKTVTNNLAKLKSEGLVEYPDSKTFKLTPAGIEKVKSLGLVVIPETNAERHDQIKQKLKKKEVQLFELMVDGEVKQKDDIAKKLGYEDKKTKAFVNLIGAVRRQKVIDYPDKDTMQLEVDFCFPLGRGNP